MTELYIARLEQERERLKNRVAELEGAIREHRGQRGHDACWLDNLRLYAVLHDGVQPLGAMPPRGEFLAGCSRYYELRTKGVTDKDLGSQRVQSEVIQHLRSLLATHQCTDAQCECHPQLLTT